jgi:hypothetical protein
MSTFNPRALTQRSPLPSRLEATGSVLVSLDGTRSGWRALEWAAAEAAARGGTLRILRSAAAPLVATGPWLWVYQPEFAALAYSTGRDDLAAAGAQAHAIDPLLPVSAELLPGAIGPALRGDGRHDALVVVGRRCGVGRIGGPVPSTVWGAMRRTRRSITVVDLTDSRQAGPSAGCVVLALGASGDVSPAIASAFRAAMRRGVGLTLLYAWGREVTGDVVDGVLAPYRSVFPEVGVQARAVSSLRHAVADESRGAALTVVVGPGRAGDAAGRVRAGRLVGAAHGPVTLVPPG